MFLQKIIIVSRKPNCDGSKVVEYESIGISTRLSLSTGRVLDRGVSYSKVSFSFLSFSSESFSFLSLSTVSLSYLSFSSDYFTILSFSSFSLSYLSFPSVSLSYLSFSSDSFTILSFSSFSISYLVLIFILRMQLLTVDINVSRVLFLGISMLI